MDMAIYVTNIVTLIGFAIAIDYSMLVVFRFREELARPDDHADALEATMATAGRATLFSGVTVAVGLALLVLMPLPFMRSMGVGGPARPARLDRRLGHPAAALLSVMGRRVDRWGGRATLGAGQAGGGVRAAACGPGWRARSCAGRSPCLDALASALPAARAGRDGPPSSSSPAATTAACPRRPSPRAAWALLEGTLGPGALSPNQVVVDTGRPGGAWSASHPGEPSGG